MRLARELEMAKGHAQECVNLSSQAIAREQLRFSALENAVSAVVNRATLLETAPPKVLVII